MKNAHTAIRRDIFMRKKINQRTTYSAEFKLKAVKMYLDDGYGFQAVAKKLNIPDKKSVRRWVKNYNTLGTEGLEERRGKSSLAHTKGKPRKKPMTLEEQVKRLQAENEYLKKYLGLERM
jgi:transposase-like protein